MSRLTLNRASLISYCLLGIFLLIFMNDVDYFINVGISIRPYFIPLFGLGMLLPHISKVFFHKYKYRLLSFLVLFFCGIGGHFFAKANFEYLFFVNQILLLLLQILTFYWVLRGLKYCDLEVFSRGMLKILPLITMIPFIIFVIQYPAYLGVRNQSVCGMFLGNDGIPRMTGLCADPNYFSLYMFSFLCMIYYLNQKCHLQFSTITILFIGIGILDIILSLSRSAWGVVCIFLLIILALQRRKNLFLAFGIIAICFFLLIHFTDPLVLDVILQRFENTGDDGSSTERLFLLQKGLEAPLYFPFGVGVGNCQYYYSLFYEKKLAHNDFVSVLIECGLLGIICYLYIWLQTFLLTDGFGKCVLFCVGIFCCTLTCYGYEPIIPLVLAFYSFYSKYK